MLASTNDIEAPEFGLWDRRDFLTGIRLQAIGWGGGDGIVLLCLQALLTPCNLLQKAGIRLLTEMLQVRVLPGEPTFLVWFSITWRKSG